MGGGRGRGDHGGNCFVEGKSVQLNYLVLVPRDEWIPFFSDIRILGYHGYLNIMDIWIIGLWIVGYHGYLDSWIPWIVRYHG